MWKLRKIKYINKYIKVYPNNIDKLKNILPINIKTWVKKDKMKS
jgi:hypothetical protein